MSGLSNAAGSPAAGGREDWVDVAKGVAILLVVGFHAVVFPANPRAGAGVARHRGAARHVPHAAVLLCLRAVRGEGGARCRSPWPRVRALAPRVQWWHPVLALTVYGAAAGLVALAGVTGVPLVRPMLAALAVLAGGTLAVALSRIPAMDWLRALGRRTLGVYLLHFYVILGFCLLLAPVADRVTEHRVLDLTLPLLLTALAVLVSLAVQRLTRRLTWLWDRPRIPRLARPNRDACSFVGQDEGAEERGEA